MNKKAFLGLSFSWLFALIVGAIILGGAIYGLTKIIHVAQESSSVKGARQIDILLNPLETSFESAVSSSMFLPVESKINLFCYSDIGNFGEQRISLSEKIRNKWSDPSIEIKSYNKYLFSNSTSTGKKFYLFSKPFEFPFKIGNLIYLIPYENSYCFFEEDFPRDQIRELESLNQENIHTEKEECTTEDITVCGKSQCDIQVTATQVKKDEKTMYYQGDALMFAAIFSEKDIYECQLKRLIKRVEVLSDIYSDKTKILVQKGCSVDYLTDLSFLKSFSSSYQNSNDLLSMQHNLESFAQKNKHSTCKLW